MLRLLSDRRHFHILTNTEKISDMFLSCVTTLKKERKELLKKLHTPGITVLDMQRLQRHAKCRNNVFFFKKEEKKEFVYASVLCFFSSSSFLFTFTNSGRSLKSSRPAPHVVLINAGCSPPASNRLDIQRIISQLHLRPPDEKVSLWLPRQRRTKGPYCSYCEIEK